MHRLAPVTISDLAALARLDPDGARRRVLDALREAGANHQAAARALGTSVRGLYRWIDNLGLWRDVDGLKRELGLPRRPRPPRRGERTG